MSRMMGRRWNVLIADGHVASVLLNCSPMLAGASRPRRLAVSQGQHQSRERITSSLCPWMALAGLR